MDHLLIVRRSLGHEVRKVDGRTFRSHLVEHFLAPAIEGLGLLAARWRVEVVEVLGDLLEARIRLEQLAQGHGFPPGNFRITDSPLMTLRPDPAGDGAASMALPELRPAFMSTIAPRGSDLREAVRYVSDQLGQEAPEPLIRIIERAALRFDLNPNQTEYLLNFYRSAPKPGAGIAPED